MYGITHEYELAYVDIYKYYTMRCCEGIVVLLQVVVGRDVRTRRRGSGETSYRGDKQAHTADKQAHTVTSRHTL